MNDFMKGMLVMAVTGPFTKELIVTPARILFEERNVNRVSYVAPSDISARMIDINYDGKDEATVLEYGGVKYLIQKRTDGMLSFQPIKGLEKEVGK